MIRRYSDGISRKSSPENSIRLLEHNAFYYIHVFGIYE